MAPEHEFRSPKMETELLLMEHGDMRENLEYVAERFLGVFMHLRLPIPLPPSYNMYDWRILLSVLCIFVVSRLVKFLAGIKVGPMSIFHTIQTLIDQRRSKGFRAHEYHFPQ